MRGDTKKCEPRKCSHGTFLCEGCELACEQVCADTTGMDVPFIVSNVTLVESSSSDDAKSLKIKNKLVK